jgi:hypothetical protein
VISPLYFSLESSSGNCDALYHPGAARLRRLLAVDSAFDFLPTKACSKFRAFNDARLGIIKCSRTSPIAKVEISLGTEEQPSASFFCGGRLCQYSTVSPRTRWQRCWWTLVSKSTEAKRVGRVGGWSLNEVLNIERHCPPSAGQDVEQLCDAGGGRNQSQSESSLKLLQRHI